MNEQDTIENNINISINNSVNSINLIVPKNISKFIHIRMIVFRNSKISKHNKDLLKNTLAKTLIDAYFNYSKENMLFSLLNNFDHKNQIN